MDDHRSRGADRREKLSAPAFPATRRDGTQAHVDERSGLDRRALGFISTFRLFRRVPYSQVEETVARCELREFPEAQLLLKRGEFNTHVAIVIRGRLRIHLDAPDSEEFIEVSAGECVGEMSIIDREPVSAYVVADAGCRLLLMDGATFLSRVLVIPEVARNLLAAFAERTRANNALIIRRMKAAMELQRLQRELRFARSVQAGMMPLGSLLFPERRDLDCSGRMTPAREVGGDFYDAFFIDADTLFIAIGDVCGKGVPAALFMVRTLTVLRSEASRRLPARKPDIRAIMKRANNLLSTGNESSMFASVFTGLLDLKSGLLSYVNAGHNAPLIAPGGDACRFLAEPRGLALGIREGFDFRAGEARLSKDSVLLLYTDGVTEAEGRGEQQFGEDRLGAVFEQSRRAGASALIEAVLSAVQAFQAGREQTDDITLLALRYIPGS